MNYIQEKYARDLANDLANALAGLPGATITCDGGGVHWKCTASRATRSCEVNCCEFRHYDVRGPKYYTSFLDCSEGIAKGRTTCSADTIAAVHRWLEGVQLVQLHGEFPFIDYQRRTLGDLEKHLLECAPELRPLPHQVSKKVADLYEFRIRTAERSCRIDFPDGDARPHCSFQWDDCQMFAFEISDPSELGLVLVSWLVESSTPSAIRSKYPWIELEPVAAYYEAGEPVEGEFIESWNSIEAFYSDFGDTANADQALAFIRELRIGGFDRRLRAGQSLLTLVLSRSRRHGLRDGQPSVAFSFLDRGLVVNCDLGTPRRLLFHKPELNSRIIVLLNELASRDID
jgi:hypothetical protein